MQGFPTLDDIHAAALRIQPYLHRTPLLHNTTINRLCAADIFFKCENFQKVGAFKARGALNAVLSLDEAALSRGVATHSSGNHAAALAWAAGIRGIPAYIVMPENAPAVKKRAVEGYGAIIRYCRPTLADREQQVAELIEQTGANFVHPFNDYRVICGQATAALEIFEDLADVDYLVAPVGGGGLLSGAALSAHYLSPATRLIGAEPAGADDAHRSLAAGKIIPQDKPDTIADGLLTSLGDLTFDIISKRVSEIVCVDDTAIIASTQLLMERMKILVEPSAAVALAVLVEKCLSADGKRVAVILSGGNIDLHDYVLSCQSRAGGSRADTVLRR